MPDRLPSLIVLVAFWIPPALAGWKAAGALERSGKRTPTTMTYALLSIIVVGYAAAWFFFNVDRMPPYITGATRDPTFASPTAVANLITFTSSLILPGSALACALAFWWRGRMSRRAPTSRVSA